MFDRVNRLCRFEPGDLHFPFITISGEPWVIAIADVFRVFILILAFMLIGAALWVAKRASNYQRLWTACICLFLVSTAGSEYVRLGQPVSSRIVINFLAIILCAIGFRMGTAIKPQPTKLN